MQRQAALEATRVHEPPALDPDAQQIVWDRLLNRDVQRSPEHEESITEEITAEAPPFVPLTRRQGDPRLIARKPINGAATRPRTLPAKSLMKIEDKPTAVLPQARLQASPDLGRRSSLSRTSVMRGAESTSTSRRQSGTADVAEQVVQREPLIKSAESPLVDPELGPIPGATHTTPRGQERVQREPPQDKLEEQIEGAPSWRGATPSSDTRSELVLGKRTREGQPSAPSDVLSTASTGELEGEPDHDDDAEVEPGNGSDTSLNLDELARQILPMVKRMLAIERERRPSR